MSWDESEHPRHPAGSSKGGEFRTKASDLPDLLDPKVVGYARNIYDTAHHMLRELHDSGEFDGRLDDLFGQLDVDIRERDRDYTISASKLLDYMIKSGYVERDDLPGPPPWIHPQDRELEPGPVAWRAGETPSPRKARQHPLLASQPMGWVGTLGARLPNPFPNNEAGVAALRARVLGTEPVYVTDLAGGTTAITNRWEFEDGTSIVRKAFYGGLEDIFEDDEDPFYDGDPEDLEGDDGDGLWFDDEQRDEAVAEIKASEIAGAIGAPALTVIADPDGEPNVVYYGYAEGTPPGYAIPASVLQTDEAVLIGVLDLLISNNDRQGGNWLITPQGKPFAIDHGESLQDQIEPEQKWVDGKWVDSEFPEGDVKLFPATGPFADAMFQATLVTIDTQTGKEVSLPYVTEGRYHMERKETWHPNRLHPDDIPVLKQRIQALRDRERLTAGDNRYMQAMLDELGKHATGTRRLVR